MITETKNLCPECGADRTQLAEWLKEPDVMVMTYDRENGYDFPLQRSENKQKAIMLIAKCSAGEKHFGNP